MYISICMYVTRTRSQVSRTRSQVQRKIEKSFVPGDFLRFRQKRDHKSAERGSSIPFFGGLSIKLETVILCDGI